MSYVYEGCFLKDRGTSKILVKATDLEITKILTIIFVFGLENYDLDLESRSQLCC